MPLFLLSPSWIQSIYCLSRFLRRWRPAARFSARSISGQKTGNRVTAPHNRLHSRLLSYRCLCSYLYRIPCPASQGCLRIRQTPCHTEFTRLLPDCLGSGLHSGLQHARGRRCALFHDSGKHCHVRLPGCFIHRSDSCPRNGPDCCLDRHVFGLDPSRNRLYDAFFSGKWLRNAIISQSRMWGAEKNSFTRLYFVLNLQSPIDVSLSGSILAFLLLQQSILLITTKNTLAVQHPRHAAMTQEMCQPI